MTCSRCSFQFCWICLSPYTSNHYDNTNLEGCPGMQFTNFEEERVIRMQFPYFEEERVIVERPAISRAMHYFVILLKILLIILLIPFILIWMGVGMPNMIYSYCSRICYPFYSPSCSVIIGLILVGFALLPLGIIFAVFFLPYYFIGAIKCLF